MSQLLVTAKKLNKRSNVPASFSEDNIIGTVNKGFQFEGTEVTTVLAPELGKWYVDRDNHFYWGGGLLVLDTAPVSIITNIKNLPIHLPAGFRVGIDVSHHNIINDWPAFKNAGITSTYIKISEGVGAPDLTAKLHADKAKENGFKIGYYHFCHPDTNFGGTITDDATAEAAEALKKIAVLPKSDLPLALDLEFFSRTADSPLKPADYLAWVNTFIEQVKEKSGIEIIIYGGKDYLDNHLPPEHNLGKNRLWIAHYGLSDTQSLKCPIGWKDWAMWQYTGAGTIGSNAVIDINIVKDPTLF